MKYKNHKGVIIIKKLIQLTKPIRVRLILHHLYE